MSRVRPPASTSTGADRVKALIIAAGDKAPASVRPYVQHIATAAAFLVVLWDRIEPYVTLIVTNLCWAYQQLPDDLIPALAGLLLCFFGGTYAALIAAVEAFTMTGWSTTKENVISLYNEYLRIKEINDKDENTDANNDGVPDVQQKTPSELLLHKAHLFMTSVKEPEKINMALTGIFGSCLSVVAVLRVQFARTVTLGVSIGNAMIGMAEKFLLPIMMQFTPKDYQQWIPLVINYICKSIAISIAWYIQKVISAFHSAIRGGLMFSRNIFNYGNKKGYFALKHEDTNIDEIVGWAVAAIGVYFQIRSGFSVPFPLNILLLPFTIAEWLIIWIVSDPSVQV